VRKLSKTATRCWSGASFILFRRRQFYVNFDQTDDDEVISILQAEARRRGKKRRLPVINERPVILAIDGKTLEGNLTIPKKAGAS
jgi:predicted phosphoribosyltransferase